MRHLGPIARLQHGRNDVVGVFLHRVVGAGRKIRTRPVVIDRHAPAHVDILDRCPGGHELGVIPTSLSQGRFDRSDIRDLAAQMPVHEPEGIEQASTTQELDRPGHFGHGQPEARPIAATLLPLAGSPRGQLDPQPQVRRDAESLGLGDDQFEFGKLFDHRNDVSPGLGRPQGHGHVFRILVAVAQDRSASGVGHRKHREQLGLRPGLESEPVGPTASHHLLDELARRIDLDREHVDVPVAVAVLGDGPLETLMQALDPGPQHVAESQQDRQLQPAPSHFLHEVIQVDRRGSVVVPVYEHGSAIAHREQPGAPVVHVVQFRGVFGGKRTHRLRKLSSRRVGHWGHFFRSRRCALAGVNIALPGQSKQGCRAGQRPTLHNCVS